jgi:uncharacterized RmlC-like cupin family protein
MSAPDHAAPTCKIIRSQTGGEFHGLQGLDYFAGISAESAGATGICMHIVRIPPGARANAHYHAGHETAIYMLSGEVEMLYGPNLEFHDVAREGDYVYIPAGVPHVPYNTSDKVAIAVLARTDPNEQESVVLTPELDTQR